MTTRARTLEQIMALETLKREIGAVMANGYAAIRQCDHMRAEGADVSALIPSHDKALRSFTAAGVAL
ncbi:MAG: hypothetical protein HGA36_02575 [Candidatus Moranbacteria bacterium]|nr:hypothetical protein [Candidatus Moranbacteria bacterium]